MYRFYDLRPLLFDKIIKILDRVGTVRRQAILSV